MTSLWRHSRLTYYDLGPNYLTQGVELLAGEVWQVSKRNSQYFRTYLRKTTGGPFAPPQRGEGPRPAGVWLVTRPAGRGDGKAPPEISQTTGPISKFQTPFDSPVRELPVQGQKFDPEVTDDVTGQVKVRIFDFSGLVTSVSKISMLSANKANESAWIVLLTSVRIMSCALWP